MPRIRSRSISVFIVQLSLVLVPGAEVVLKRDLSGDGVSSKGLAGRAYIRFPEDVDHGYGVLDDTHEKRGFAYIS